MYDKWGKPEKLEPYNSQLIAVLGKQFGPNSPQLAGTLDKEAQTLRTLGRTQEKLDDAHASISWSARDGDRKAKI
jgi:ABC-type transporter Mla subunit MlaD